jgi:hypothetical protein
MEKQKLPNATTVLILGILSIPACCFYGIGLALGIAALVVAKQDLRSYRLDPDNYEGYGNLKTGRILAIIGIVLNALLIIFMIAIIVVFGMAALEDPALMQEKIRQMSAQ